MRKTMKELVQVEQTVEKIYCNICGKNIQNIIDSEYFEYFDVGKFEIDIRSREFKPFTLGDICTTCAKNKIEELMKFLNELKSNK